MLEDDNKDSFDDIMCAEPRIRNHEESVSGLDMQYNRNADFCKQVKDFFRNDKMKHIVNAQLKRGDDSLGDVLHNIATHHMDPQRSDKALDLWKTFDELRRSAPGTQRAKDI